MLNNIRESIIPIIDRIGLIFAKTGISPTGWSIVGLLFAMFSGIAFSMIWLDWFWGGIFLLVSGFFDIVDGSVARITNNITKRGAFLDSVFDRVSEIFVYGGLIIGGIGEPVIIFAALTSSMMVSYTRTKGESLNVKVSGIGIGERAERIFILAILSIIGYPYYGVTIILVLASFTFLQRLIFITKKLGNNNI
ncbi:CDP-alcohol phosphatidyltransferase family protein [Thermoproteota archaeon]